MEPGAAFTIEGQDADRGTQVAWDSETALWRTAVVELAVADAVGADGDNLRFGITFNGSVDPDSALASARALGQVAVVLNEVGTYSYDAKLHRIAHEGGLLARVDDGGGLHFAEDAAPGDDFVTYTQGIDSVEELMAAARADDLAVRRVAGPTMS